MRLRVNLKGPLAMAAALLASCSSRGGTDVTFSVIHGKQYCEVFEIPRPWAITPPTISGTLHDIEYRWPMGDSRTEVMVSPPRAEELDLVAGNSPVVCCPCSDTALR